jgi:hypothetical protein
MSGKRPGRASRAPGPWLERVSPHEGPEGTLFMHSKGERLWYVLGVEGSEARLSARDLRSFVDKCIAARESG